MIGKAPNIKNENLHLSSFSSVLDLIENKLKENEAIAEAGRITTPFEARIDKKSITESDLKRIGNLPIEISLCHDKKGLILSTGSKGSTRMDFGDYEKVLFDEEKATMSHFGYLDDEIALKYWPLYAIQNARKNQFKRFEVEQDYVGHNHPNGSLSTSISDIYISGETESEIDWILTKDGIIFYKASPGQCDRLDSLVERNNEGIDVIEDSKFCKFVNDEGLIKKAVMFDTPEMSNVVEFLQSNKTWPEIKDL
jgi:hypothetical protein